MSVARDLGRSLSLFHMSLSRDEASSLYLLCLGRSVESEQAADAYAHHSPEDCAIALLQSLEFDVCIMQPILSGEDLRHVLLPEHAIAAVRAFAARQGKVFFGEAAAAYESWHPFVLDLIMHPRIHPSFAAYYPNHIAFVELVKIRFVQSKAVVSVVEEINSSSCRGYILDPRDPDRDLVLRLRLNGSTVALIPALRFRRDIQDKYGGTGRVGFEIEFGAIPDFDGLSVASIDLVEASSGFALLANHKLALSRTPLLEARDNLLATLHGARRAVDDMINRLDGYTAEHPISIAGYGQARASARRPEAPSSTGSIAVIIDAMETTVGEAVMGALVGQSHQPICLWVVGEVDRVDVEARAVIEGSRIPIRFVSARERAAAETSAELADFFVLMSATERLEADALAWLVYAAERPGAQAAYADSETEGDASHSLSRLTPVFRSALDPDLLLTSDEYDGLLCVRRALMTEPLDKPETENLRLALLLRSLERHGRTSFRHVPLVLSRIVEASDRELNAARRRILVQAHLDRACPGARIVPHDDAATGAISDRSLVRWPTVDRARIGVIVPTRDALDMVTSLLASLKTHTALLSRLRVYVVSNNSAAPQTRLALDVLRQDEIVTVLEREGPFNWSALNDDIIRAHSDEDIIVCLNNDMICETPGWDNLLRAQLARTDVDVVGGRLLYANGMLQHAGVAMVGGVWLHEGMGDAPSHGLYRERTRIAHECSAVTGAFLAFTRRFYQDVGGFDVENFPVSYNDIEFCVRSEKYGARILYDPEQIWIHFESETRGFDAHDPAKQQRTDRERRRVLEQLPRSDYLDLSNNLHFLRNTRPFSLVGWPRREEVLSWIDQQRTRHADRPASRATPPV